MSVSQYLFLAVTQLGQMSCLPAKDENLFLAVRQHRHQYLSEHVKATFSQSEEVFSNSHITINVLKFITDRYKAVLLMWVPLLILVGI